MNELQFDAQHALQEVRHDKIRPISRLICVFKLEECCSKGRQGHTNAARCPSDARSSKGIRGCRDPDATRREAQVQHLPTVISAHNLTEEEGMSAG